MPPALEKKPFRFYYGKHRRLFTLGIGALFFTNLFDVLTPLALKAGIDQVVAKDVDSLGLTIVVYLALMAGVALFRWAWRIYFGTFNHTVAEDLRNRIFNKLTVLGPSFFQKNPVGELMSLITNDVNAFRMAIGPGTLILLDAVFYVVMIVPLMLMLSPDWTWKTMILLPAVPFFMRYMERRIHEQWRYQQDRLSEVSGSAQEIVSGVRVIKSYAQEQNQRAQFNQLSEVYERACNKVAKTDSFFHPIMEFAASIGIVILLYFGSSDVVREGITLGTFVAFLEYIKKMVWPMSALGFGASMVEQGRASFDRIRELLKTETDIPDDGQEMPAAFESLEVQNLTFQYPAADHIVLKNVSFQLTAGETIGIVGPVGSGKTTLMQLICRLFPVEPGTIRINGVSLEKISQAALRQLISFVPQDTFLFSDTVGQNVALGMPAYPGHQAVQHITRVVNIDHEIESLPEGYEAWLGERGVNLSGGQKQRLTIARALIRHSPLVILDDSLSAVDVKTEQSIVSRLKTLTAERERRHQTTVIVSHRLATLRNTDRIIVLNEGQIEAIGSHDELLESSATYRRLELLQSEERLTAMEQVARTGPEGA